MSWIFLTGLVLLVVPLIVVLGFLIYIAFQFVKDDDDAFNVLKIAIGISFFGFLFIIIDYAISLL